MGSGCLYTIFRLQQVEYQNDIFVFVHFAFEIWHTNKKWLPQRDVCSALLIRKWFRHTFCLFVCVFLLLFAFSQWTPAGECIFTLLIFAHFSFSAISSNLFIYYFAYGCHSLCILWIDQTIIIFKLLFDFGKCCFCFRLSAMMTLNQSNKRFPIAVICCGLQSDDFVAAAKNENKKKQMKRVNTNWILILISQDYAQHTHAVLLCIKLNKNIYEVFQRHHYTHGLCVYHLDGPVNDNKQREKAWWKPFKTNKMVYGFDVLLKFVTLNQFMDFI